MKIKLNNRGSQNAGEKAFWGKSIFNRNNIGRGKERIEIYLEDDV